MGCQRPGGKLIFSNEDFFGLDLDLLRRLREIGRYAQMLRGFQLLWRSGKRWVGPNFLGIFLVWDYFWFYIRVGVGRFILFELYDRCVYHFEFETYFELLLVI